MGFVGVDNPDMKKSRLIRRLLSLLGYYIGVAVDAYKKECTKLEMASIKSRQKYRRNIEEIFRGAQIGIWSIIKQEGKEPVMEADANMRELLGLTKGTTSEECYRIWRDNIPSEYTEKVDNCVKETLEKGYADVIYPWHHPTRGKIWIRCGGVRPKDYEGIGVCIRGYHQDVTKNIEREMRFRSLKAATSEIYYAIYNINLNTDYMEQISEPNKMYKIANDRGIASEKLMDFCTFQIHEDYQEEMRKFFDLSTLGEQEIDLILMDIMMPVMDGLEATRRIRTCTHPRGATVPIIAISANAFADDIQKAKNAGMNEHLAKPFEMEKVLRAISRYHKV